MILTWMAPCVGMNLSYNYRIDIWIIADSEEHCSVWHGKLFRNTEGAFHCLLVQCLWAVIIMTRRQRDFYRPLKSLSPAFSALHQMLSIIMSTPCKYEVIIYYWWKAPGYPLAQRYLTVIFFKPKTSKQSIISNHFRAIMAKDSVVGRTGADGSAKDLRMETNRMSFWESGFVEHFWKGKFVMKSERKIYCVWEKLTRRFRFLFKVFVQIEVMEIIQVVCTSGAK